MNVKNERVYKQCSDDITTCKETKIHINKSQHDNNTNSNTVTIRKRIKNRKRQRHNKHKQKYKHKHSSSTPSLFLSSTIMPTTERRMQVTLDSIHSMARIKPLVDRITHVLIVCEGYDIKQQPYMYNRCNIIKSAYTSAFPNAMLHFIIKPICDKGQAKSLNAIYNVLINAQHVHQCMWHLHIEDNWMCSQHLKHHWTNVIEAATSEGYDYISLAQQYNFNNNTSYKTGPVRLSSNSTLSHMSTTASKPVTCDPTQQYNQDVLIKSSISPIRDLIISYPRPSNLIGINFYRALQQWPVFSLRPHLHRISFMTQVQSGYDKVSQSRNESALETDTKLKMSSTLWTWKTIKCNTCTPYSENEDDWPWFFELKYAEAWARYKPKTGRAWPFIFDRHSAHESSYSKPPKRFLTDVWPQTMLTIGGFIGAITFGTRLLLKYS